MMIPSKRAPLRIPASSVERLESRIAPAALVKNVLTYTDIDGDLVTIKFGTHAVVTEANLTFDTPFATSGPQQLQAIDFTASDAFDGVSITMTVKIPPGGTGDGLANIGSISGNRFGNISILGDVGNFTIGGDSRHPSAGKITVNSIGEQLTTTPGLSPISTFDGNVGSLTVEHDVNRAFLTFDGNLGALTIKGSLLGAPDSTGLANGPDNTGEIVVDQNAGKVLIDGDLTGGTGQFSGYLELDGKTASVTVLGQITGSSGYNSGGIGGGILGHFTLRGTILGGGGDNSGLVSLFQAGTVLVDGNLMGGDGQNSGEVEINGPVTSVTILGNIQGGGGQYSGYLDIEGKSALVTLGNKKVAGSGNLTGGNGDESGVLFFDAKPAAINILGSITAGSQILSGAILAESALGTIQIHGSIEGTVGPGAYVPVSISAVQQAGANAASDVTIKSLTIDGNAIGLLVRAGYDGNTPLDPDAQIGAVAIRGNFGGTSVIAGVMDVAGDGFGNSDDTVIPASITYPDRPKVFASIASIVLQGVNDGSEGSNDQFGFEAELISKAAFGGHALHLLKGPGNDFAIPLDNGTTVLNEVPV